MKRRTLLAGMGSTILGASYAFDTGAFSQTEAERQVSISTSNDADAYLRLTPGPGDTAGFVSQNGDGVVTVAIGSIDGAAPAEGANPGVVTAFDDLLRIGNYGTDPVAVSATLPPDGGVALMTAYEAPDTIDTLDEGGVELSLAPGESGLAGIAIDTGYGTDEIPGTIGSGDVEITITAQAE